MSTETPHAPQSPERAMAGGPAAPRSRGGRMGIVFRKEFREIFRDKRTLFGVVLSPLLITPLLLGLMGSVIGKQQKAAQVTVHPVGIVGAAGSPTIHEAIKDAPNLKFSEVTRAEAEAKVKSRDLRAAAVLPEDADTLFKEDKAVPVKVLFDAGNDTSKEAAMRLEAAFTMAGAGVVKARLQMRQLSPEMAEPFRVTQEPISTGGTSGTFVLAMFLPYILTISAITGGLHAANDIVAGEKERGTLETLLVSPASRRDLVMGKFLAIAGVCLVSSLLSVVGLMIPFYLPIEAFAWMARGGLSLTPAAVAVILAVQLPLAVLFAGLLLAISTFSRNQKEAQTYLGPLMILVMIPAMLSMMLKAEMGVGVALVPVLNATLVLKQALVGVFSPAFIGVAFVSSVVYAGLAVMFATSLFQKESVLLKT